MLFVPILMANTSGSQVGGRPVPEIARAIVTGAMQYAEYFGNSGSRRFGAMIPMFNAPEVVVDIAAAIIEKLKVYFHRW